MPRARHVSLVPTTPGGAHLRTSDLSVDEIEIDDEIVVKSSVFRGESNLKTETEQKIHKQQVKPPKRTPKYVVRKSTDLKKIKNIDDRIEAILASPMIEKRRRPLGSSRSLEAEDRERAPLRVPSSRDLQAVSSQRMSAIVMSKFAPFLHSSSFTEGEQHYMCPVKLNRRKTIGGFGASSRPSEMNMREPKHENTPVTPAPKNISYMSPESTELDEQENVESMPSNESPLEQNQSVLQQQDPDSVVRREPTSVSEFRVLVNMEISRLSASKAAWEDVMEEEGTFIPEAALMHIRAAVGKCNLLIKKRLQTFFALIDHTEESLRRQHLGDEAELTSRQRSSINDLLGMWANIAQQISDIDRTFDRLRRWRDTTKWAFDSPPVTPAASKNSKSNTVSRTRKPSKPVAWKSKGSLKQRLVKPTESKLRAPKIPKRSNLAHFKAQMLVRKKAMEADGSSAGIVIFGGRHNADEELRTLTPRGRSSKSVDVPEPSRSRMSTVTPQSARHGKSRRSRSIASDRPNQPEISEENVLSSPVHESSRNLLNMEPTTGQNVAVSEEVEANSEIEHSEFAEDSVVHGTSASHKGDESELKEESVKMQSRKSGAVEFFHIVQNVEPKLAAESVAPIRSPKRERPRKSAVSEAGNKIAVVQSEKGRRSRKSFAMGAVSPSQNAVSKLVEKKEASQSPKRGRPRKSTVPAPVIDVDVVETADMQFSKHRRARNSSLFVPDSQELFDSSEVGKTFQSPRRRSLRKLIFDESQVTDQSAHIQTPIRGRSRRSVEPQAQITDSDVVERTPILQSSKRGSPRKSIIQATPAAALETSLSSVNSAPQGSNETFTSPPGRGRPPKVPRISEVDLANVSENASSRTSDGNFLIPDSLPRKRLRMDHSLLSNSQASGVSSTPNPFSPPPRPATGTPRPHMSQLMRTKVNSSLSQSVLRKQLMLATTCGGSSSGRSSGAAGSTQSDSGKSPIGRPRKSVRFLTSPDPSGNSKASLPVTPHIKSSTDPNRRVSQRVRRQRDSP